MLIVTGATGFIGKNLIPVLMNSRRIRILARKTSNVESFRGKRSIEIVYGDLENNQGIETALTGVNTVIHCAARTIGRNFAEYYRTNVQGTANLVEAMKRKSVKNILFLSSSAVCGPRPANEPFKESDIPKPISFYGRTKMISEQIIMKSGLDYTILRPAAVYGPFDLDVLKYIALLNHGICPIIGFGEIFLNIIYVADLVQLIVKIVEINRFTNRTYLINDGTCYSLKEILDKISVILHKKSRKIHIPKTVAMICGLLNDIFLPAQKRVIWRDKVKELTKDHWLCSNEKSVAQLDFKTRYTLEQGMQETIEWYRNNGLLK